ncbi:hypothetical protein [Sulfurimonas sp.]
MKKIILSAAVAAMAFSTSAMAADKGIDIDVSGQAVAYYETHDANGGATDGLFDNESSVAAAGLQLNLGSDLGNNFTFGSQLTYLGSLGLEKSIVDGQKQVAGSTATASSHSTLDQLALTKIFIAKQIANTTLKMGRQELPKSLSPLAFSEGWNVYKNTFDAIVAINSDLPKTTLVGAYVTGGTGMSLGTTGDLVGGAVAGETYMITASTKAIPMATVTASYYALKQVLGTNSGLTQSGGVDTNAIWVDAQIALPADLKLGLQGGNIDVDSAAYADTNAFGAKLSGKIGAIGLKAIYTTVDGDTKSQIQIRNTGTNIKSPLYSQMMYNQKAIDLDNDTVVIGASYNMGAMGTVAANYGMTELGKDSDINTAGKDQDYNELDLVYKVKSGGVQYFAIAAIRDFDKGLGMNTTQGTFSATADKDTIVRLWARYNF